MQIIPIASGKGGVGKSLVSANLAIALAQSGKRVVLVDLDLGASNLHLVLGNQSPKAGLGTFLTGNSEFEEIIVPTDYANLMFIPGDSEIPGMSSIKAAQKNMLIKKLQASNCDFLLIDLGAGTHLSILDFFLLSPQGILVTAPTVTAILDGYLFLKNAVFRLMYNSFKKNSKAYAYLEKLKNDAASMQRLYIPKLIDAIAEVDPENAELFRRRMKQFRPRLILNMLESPKDAEKALKIRRSCKEYLGVELEHLGVIYRDVLQDIALASRLPIIVYKPQSVLAQAIYRIADKVRNSETLSFDQYLAASSDSFTNAEEDAAQDFETKMTYIEDLVGTGTLTIEDVADVIKAQQYEITQLKKENALLKQKILKAHSQGFSV
ncbi:MAG: P-loop NTPase [Spirochaetaceae bacterium]|nr:P-loop NTPase [Spirochaetaceae bacterium]MBO4727868.1 P-loop NTPase [Spirochaetaceae bacterium]MBR4823234.1 P-loop NTPase [Spirochaetaceae bacterium]